MTITIIGKISPQIRYEDWSTALKGAVNISQVSAFFITGGRNMLNNFVRKLCKDYNVRLVEWESSETGNLELAKLLRNQQMIADCDKVVAFMTDDSTVSRSTIAHNEAMNNSPNKPVIIINLS